jgi:hypothetical protein
MNFLICEMRSYAVQLIREVKGWVYYGKYFRYCKIYPRKKWRKDVSNEAPEAVLLCSGLGFGVDGQPLFEEDFEACVSGPVCRKLFDRTYGKRDAQWLSQLTQMEEPWKKARAGTADRARENIISKESMSVYYGSL